MSYQEHRNTLPNWIGFSSTGRPAEGRGGGREGEKRREGEREDKEGLENKVRREKRERERGSEREENDGRREERIKRNKGRTE